MAFDSKKFISDLNKKFSRYSEEELAELLEQTGFYALPDDLKTYLDYRNYPNSLWQIQTFISIPEKPLDSIEMYSFWMDLTIMERIELRHVELR